MRFCICRSRLRSVSNSLKLASRLTNSSETQAASDIRLRCQATSETGRVLNRYRVTISRVVPPASTIGFGPVDVGYMDPQAQGVTCRIIGASPAYGFAPNRTRQSAQRSH